jgi:hypothetical protein
MQGCCHLFTFVNVCDFLCLCPVVLWVAMPQQDPVYNMMIGEKKALHVSEANGKISLSMFCTMKGPVWPEP